MLQMLLDAYAWRDPLGMIRLLPQNATVADAASEVHLHELAALAAEPYLASEDGPVLLLCERDFIFHKLEVPIAVQLQHHAVLMATLQQSALHQGREGRREIDIAWHEAYPLFLVESPCHPHEVEVIGRVEGVELIVLELIQIDVVVAMMLMERLCWQRAEGFQLVVIPYSVLDIVPVGPLAHISQEALHPASVVSTRKQRLQIFLNDIG